MNNKLLKKFSPTPLLCALFGFGFTFSTCVSAEPLTLSNVPLQATGKVEPNLMILMDSSGSMGNDLTSGETRLAVAQEAATQLVRGLGGLRVGLARFDGNDGATMLQGLTSLSDPENPTARDDIITKITGITAGGNTPLGEAMAELGRYYVQGYQDRDVTVDPAISTDPLPAGSILSSGPNYGSVPVPGTGEDAAIQYYCQANFILALTDGLPTQDNAVSTYLADFDQDGNGDNGDVLDDVAKALHDVNWRPDLVDPNDPEHSNNIVSHFIGFADTDLADNALLQSAGEHGGGSYQFADSAETLASSLNEAVSSISNSIGTQASVAFNSTSLDIGSVIYSAKFDTSDFSGRLYARSLNPDTGRISGTLWEASKELANKSSNTREIISYRDGLGVPFTATALELDDDPSVLASAHEEDLSVLDTNADTTDALSIERLQYIRGNADNDDQGDFRPRGNFVQSIDGINGTKLLGDIVHSTPIYVGKPELNWPSTFGGNTSAESYEQFRINYADRTPMVYVGANDGMLHGFNANTGEEQFAYIPSLLLDSTRYKGLHSFTHKDYPHNYYVDLTPAVSDVYINPPGADDDQWATVLVGGLRGGGKGYFALNVTESGTTDADGVVTGSSFDESNADNIVMWEFDGADDAANLGYSYSEAQVAKLNNGKWAVIFGNGYNSDSGVAGLFIVYIEEGADGSWDTGDWKFISTGVGTLDERKNGLSSPRLIDLNGDRIVDRVYAGDLMGNMWSFDLADKDNSVGSGTDDEFWGVYGGKPLFSPGDDLGQPHAAILSAPLVARNTNTAPANNGANVLVMFGTGQYLNGGDLIDDEAGAFYAVWDNASTVAGSSVVAGDLATQVLATVGSNRIVDGDNSTAVNWATHKGWKMVLDSGAVDATGFAGERIITSPTVRRNTLFFSTISPNPQPCASSGSGYLMSLDFRTGRAGNDAVADFNGDGEINAQDEGFVGKQFQACTEDCGEGGGSGGDPGMPGQSGFIGDVRCTPGSSGDVICDDVDVGDEGREGRLSWEEFSPR